jgi:hypothetical protein
LAVWWQVAFLQGRGCRALPRGGRLFLQRSTACLVLCKAHCLQARPRIYVRIPASKHCFQHPPLR